MKHFEGTANLGLREKDSNKLVAVYPYPVQGDVTDIQDKVFFWYYQQSCSAENDLDNLYIDQLNDNELKQFENNKDDRCCH